jgi:predicted RNA-binding protein with PUA-like domain
VATKKKATKKTATKTSARAPAAAKKSAAKARAKKPAAPAKKATKAPPKPKARPPVKARPALPPRREGERRHWIVKSEPSVYPWSKMLAEGRTVWDGIRSYEARNNLRAMRVDDLALFYHSGEGREIVGVVRVVDEASPDPAAPGEDWSVVGLAPVRALNAPVSLATLKSRAALAGLELLAKSRLSVSNCSVDDFREILALAGTTLEGA